MSQCQEFTTTGGYNYHTFFEIDKFRGNKASDYIVNLKFFILASKDAHILLSKEEHPSLKTPVYEFGKFELFFTEENKVSKDS